MDYLGTVNFKNKYIINHDSAETPTTSARC